MIILRNKYYSSKKLPESRIGVGWIQEKLGKNEAEKYLKVGEKIADEKYKEGKDDDTIVKKSAKGARNRLILDKSGKPILKGTVAAGIGYGLAKSPRIIEELGKYNGLEINIPSNIKNNLSKHSGKIALGTGLVIAGKHVPEIYKKAKAVKTGVEINTKNKLKKAEKSDNIKK